MFRGSVPAALKSIIFEHAKGWGEDVYVGCSGALTIERTLAGTGKRLHGNDVLLYSSAIGCHLAGRPLEVALSEEAARDFPWMVDWMGSATHRLATILISSRLAMSLGRTGHAYYGRLADAHETQWRRMHDRTVERIDEAAAKISLAGFTPEDVATWIDRVPPEAAVVMYPPFFARDYTAQFARMERMFDWERPGYVELTDDGVEALTAKITAREHWMVGRHHPIPGLAKHLRAKAQTTNRGVAIWVYASGGHARVVAPRQAVEGVNVKRLGPGMELGDRMALAPLTTGQFASLRSVYMNRHINPGMASLAVAVLVDGILVGAYALSYGSAPHAHWEGKLALPRVYLLSDFPVAGSDYRRLAKLVLFAAVSRESQLLIERYAHQRFRSVNTTAYSERPVSMKYRGVFDLLIRKEQTGPVSADPGEAYYQQRYQLEYGSALGRWSLEEGLRLWKQKHGSDRLVRV